MLNVCKTKALFFITINILSVINTIGMDERNNNYEFKEFEIITNTYDIKIEKILYSEFFSKKIGYGNIILELKNGVNNDEYKIIKVKIKSQVLSEATKDGDFSKMFCDHNNLIAIDFSEDFFDDINVKNISYMFYNCSSLLATNVLKYLNTFSITNVCGAFSNCTSLAFLPYSYNFGTRNFTDISLLFEN